LRKLQSDGINDDSRNGALGTIGFREERARINENLYAEVVLCYVKYEESLRYKP